LHGGRTTSSAHARMNPRGNGLFHRLRIEGTRESCFRSVWRGGADRRLDRLCRGGRGDSRSWLRPAGRRRAWRSLGPWQEEERIEIAVRLAASPHAKVNVRHRQLGLAARADRADRQALRDRCAAQNRHGSEMKESDRVAVLGLDRDGPTADGDGSCEGDDSGRRREHRRPRGRSDVDSAVLARCIRVVAEQKGSQYRTLHRPCPAQSRVRPGQHDGDRSAHQQSHRQQEALLVVRYANIASVARATVVVKLDYSEER
jgi:hypothetical protein